MAFQKNIYQKLLFIAFFMTTLTGFAQTSHITTIEVLGKKPNQLYEFMFSLDKAKYVDWHKTVHKDFRIVKKTVDTIGSIFFFHEQMPKLTIKYEWQVVELVKNQKIVMKAQSFIPIYLVLNFREIANGTFVTHELRIGGKCSISNFLIRNFIFTKSKKQSVSEHAIEEFKNFESLLTNQSL
jgi:hypothetical protein